MYVAQWLDAHARLRPHQIAVVDRGHARSISYAQLHRAAAERAAGLHALGLRAGDRVAVLSVNCVEMLELLFACARLGTVMVPLNYRLSDAELQRILDDCRPRLLLVEPGRSVPAPAVIQTMPLDAPLAAGADPLPALPDPTAPLLILYTGGTTGVPKGAILTQRTMQWNAWNTIAGWGLRPDDVAPIFTPFFHTGGLNVLATPLLCLGARIVLPGGNSFDAEDAMRLVEEEGCTQVFMVPTMFAMLREAPGFDPQRLRGVRAFTSGGAPCPGALFEAYWADGLPLRQGYGLTEAGPNTFGSDVTEAQRRAGTVGTPLPGIAVRLEKADGTEAGVDEVGELLIRGEHVTPGYWERPEDSAKAIQDGWLRTGDLARRDADHYYYICGRSKEMYISGGENVFPAEVEEVLAAHPEVAEAAVVGVPDERWGEVGRAFVVARSGSAVGPEALVEFCRGRLARYKTPRDIRMVEALPKSPAGKVLKRMLVELTQESSAGGTQLAPRSR